MKMVFMPRLPRVCGVLLVVCALLLSAACGSAGADASKSEQGRVSVVAAFYPFQFVGERVAGTYADVQSLTQPGAEPHDVELTPKQVAGLSDADLVIYQRSFQPAVDEAVAQNENVQVLDTTSVVPVQPLASADGHDEGLDPHIWLDPTNLARIARAVAERLATIDPTHAEDYTRKAAELTAELNDLDQRFTTGLSSCKRTTFITAHAAFGYLARRYGLSQIGITGLSPDAEPSPARIAEVQAKARQHGVTTIFYETLVSPAVAESIARDLGLKTGVLDPVEGITADSLGSDYLSVMQANLTALRSANACA
jgi:zinc transport system substrate-binding protein